jgi:hypothetical protein
MAEVRKSNRSKNGNKKHGRNKKWCMAYEARGQREKNKRIKLKKHLDRYPNDNCAKDALKNTYAL